MCREDICSGFEAKMTKMFGSMKETYGELMAYAQFISVYQEIFHFALKYRTNPYKLISRPGNTERLLGSLLF